VAEGVCVFVRREKPVVRQVARSVVKSLLGAQSVNRAVRALARVRGHRLVLVYHRVGAAVRPGCELIPSVPQHVFRLQLQTLGEVVDFVTLDELLQDEPLGPTAGHGRRPAVALTFDDDLPSHVEHALPVLQELGVPAAFFLSGRALSGLGAYWFQDLEALLLAYGEQRSAAMLRAPDRPEGLMLACERNGDLRRRVSELAAEMSPDILQRDGIAALVAANMTVGFHTLNHDTLPDLDDRMLEDAVSRGVEELAAITGASLKYFAYPHGKGDARSAAAVERAGFKAAFTGAPHAVRRNDDRYRLGRWEPGPLGKEDLLAKVAVRLHRTASQP
jgi:peptidoglycan/xylan/chitin deacetylase (PgdA/CDA1 family)